MNKMDFFHPALALLLIPYIILGGIALDEITIMNEEKTNTPPLVPEEQPITEWRVPAYNGYLGGILSRVDSNEGVLELVPPKKESLGKHGRIFWGKNTMQNEVIEEFSVTSDITIVRSVWGARFFFDFHDGFNFSSVYLSNFHEKVGIETWENSQRTVEEIDYVVEPGKEYRVQFNVNKKHVNVYVNGIHVIEGDVNHRREGEVGIESYKGILHIHNYTFTPITPSVNEPITLAKP